MHLTLKQETARPPVANIIAQQERFETFVTAFNTEQPHEALAMKIPGGGLYLLFKALYRLAGSRLPLA